LRILHELAELARALLRKLRKATSGEGEGGAQQPPPDPKTTRSPPTSNPKPARRTKPKRAKSRRRAASTPPLTRKDYGLLVNYGPALLESMSEADLAAIPEWIQKSFAAVPEYTETEKQKLLKVIWDSGASLSISNARSDFVGPLDEAPTAHI
jgi:hypothetical protein